MRNDIQQDVLDFIKANQADYKVTRIVIMHHFSDADEDLIHNALFKLRSSGRITAHSQNFFETYYTV